ncbi:DUF928 domain-containing protein [Trichocoleus desertorum AS-A10]|uniref:DUF928 domain-containing protein n=1 Tax=Trichocoleus desertorum TaxID=1481672 RepID=UPI003299CCD1
MFCIKSLFCYTSISLALALELAIALNMTVTITPSTATTLSENGKRSVYQQARKPSPPPPPPTNPGSSAAGGRRNPAACPQDAVAGTKSSFLTAFSPTSKPGLTVAAHPTFLVYVPRTRAETAEFSLRNRAGQGIYRTTIALSNTPDIISITLPDQVAPLEIGRTYVWSFAVICNPTDRVADQFVTGIVQRTKLSLARLRQIEQTPPRQRLGLYQEDAIWYDAVALLFKLKRSQTNDSDISRAWRQFMQAGGMETMVNVSPARSR